MDEDLTPEQKKQLKTWAFQRDALLRDIGILQTQKEADIKTNNDLSASHTEIQDKINVALGRLQELNIKEEEFRGKISKETSDLLIEKTKLQTEIPALQKEVGSLHSEKDLLVSTIKTLIEIHEKVFEKTGTLESILSNVKDTSDKNIVAIHELFTDLTAGLTALVEKTNQSNSGADVILEKLPRWIFELQRPVSLKEKPPRMINRVIPEKTI